MATRPTAARVRRGRREMPPYDWQGEIDYASLEFGPDTKETTPDDMRQNREIREIIWLISTWLEDFYDGIDVFIDNETNICYDRRNLNVRIAPDVYLAFGVNPDKILERKLYLPWEAKKPPDLVLEVASDTTARNDVERKPAIYALIGVLEYWLFDPTGGALYGKPLIGLRLVDGEYQPIELTREPDGILKGHSEVLGLSLCWDAGWPRIYDPSTGMYVETRQDLKASRRAAEERLDEERAVRIATEVVRDAMAEQRDAERNARLAAEEQRDAMAEQRDAERNARLAAEAELERLRRSHPED